MDIFPVKYVKILNSLQKSIRDLFRENCPSFNDSLTALIFTMWQEKYITFRKSVFVKIPSLKNVRASLGAAARRRNTNVKSYMRLVTK